MDEKKLLKTLQEWIWAVKDRSIFSLEDEQAYSQLKSIVKKHFADYVNTSIDRGKHWKEE